MPPASRTGSRVALVGPGAIGLTVAAALDEVRDVDLLVCGRRDEPRLRLERDGRDAVRLSVGATADPTRIEDPVDWVVLAVKAHQVDGAKEWLAALCDRHTTVVVLQNGVEHERLVAPLVGRAALVPAVVWIRAEPIAPGRARLRGPARLVVPDEPPGRAFALLLHDSWLQVEPTADFAAEAWEKLMMNAVSSLMALTGREAGMFARADVQGVARELARECLAVGRAEGACLDSDLPDVVVARFAAMAPDLGTSILSDRRADRPLEWSARNGVISRLGREHAIPTPVSDVVAPLLAAASETPRADGTVPPNA